MSEKHYIILWKDYLEGCGWINRVWFSDSLEDIEKAIGPEGDLYDDDAEVFEIKKVERAKEKKR